LSKSSKSQTTLYDVAEYVGVSKSTVAYVMSGKASKVGVADKTALRVKEAAEKLGYVPNCWASNLARQRSGIISVLLSDLTLSWANEVMKAIAGVIRSTSYTSSFAVDWNDPEVFAQEIMATMRRRDEGVICHSFVGNTNQYSALIKSGIPLVFLADVPEEMDWLPGINTVVWDDGPAVKTAVRHLIKTGRKKIAFLGSHHDLISDTSRFSAYKESLSEAGINVNLENLPTINYFVIFDSHIFNSCSCGSIREVIINLIDNF